MDSETEKIVRMENRGQKWGNFFLGFGLAVLLFIFILMSMIFSAYYQPDGFGNSYREIFCSNLK
jgi:hypothetical protein